MSKLLLVLLIFVSLCFLNGCQEDTAVSANTTNVSPTIPISAPNSNVETNNQVSPTPTILPTETPQTTTSPIGKFDFKNYVYPLPRGWQDEDGKVTLENGKAPLSMTDEEKKIGAKYIKTKYGDVTGDGQDEAFVVIKIETGGSAIPQVVYIFDWKNGKPELIWDFRTGDRADGGLKDIRAENGELVVELYGQDRFIFGDVETMKVTGDEEDLCCPTFFTRNRYKLTGGRFTLQGKRETYSIKEPNAPPIENLGDKVAEELKKGKR